MRVAGGQVATRLWVAWILLDREEQLRRCLIEAPAEETRGAYYTERHADTGARTEPQRRFFMLNRDLGLARIHSEDAADVPAASVIRVESQGAVDQRHHGTDVLAEICQRKGGVPKNARVIAAHFQGSPGLINALQSVRLRISAPAVKMQPITADRGRGEGWPVTRIALDRLFK